jgi:hypothetical protein
LLCLALFGVAISSDIVPQPRRQCSEADGLCLDVRAEEEEASDASSGAAVELLQTKIQVHREDVSYAAQIALREAAEAHSVKKTHEGSDDDEAQQEGSQDGEAQQEGSQDDEAQQEGSDDGETQQEGSDDDEAQQEGFQDGEAQQEGSDDGEALEDLSGLQVVENATSLASVTRPRPTSCPKVFKRCDRGGGHSEADQCSCGIRWGNIPGPECSQDPNSQSGWKPTPYWGTGYNGCYCWCWTFWWPLSSRFENAP